MSNITRSAIWFRTGPPRMLLGLKWSGYAIRTGVSLPPASGAARTATLRAEGEALLAEARREYRRVLRQVISAAGNTLPPVRDLSQPVIRAHRLAAAQRQRQWKISADNLKSGIALKAASNAKFREGDARDLLTLERQARAALGAAVDSFNYLEDTELAGEAHTLAHTIGELTAGLFGCQAKKDGEDWYDVCRLSLMHLRIGLSTGFQARIQCSVCDDDLSECDHLPGVTYNKIAGRRPDGSCTICGAASCHVRSPGIVYPEIAHGIVRDVERLDELSCVPRPRDPLARISAIQIHPELVAELSNRVALDAFLCCEFCFAPCAGFTSAEEALGIT